LTISEPTQAVRPKACGSSGVAPRVAANADVGYGANMDNVNESLADECPKCGAISYRGGNCFRCDTFRPAKHAKTVDVEDLDASQFMRRSFGTQMTAVDLTEEELDDRLQEAGMRARYR